MLSSTLPIKILTRNEWGAKTPTLIEHFNGPSKFVIIHHSYIPPACYTREQCTLAMVSMQEFHQIDRGWNDIGYSFGIGGDGNIYEGRGFNVIGAHAPRYNDKSVGICLIGDWRTELPSEQMLEATRRLINWGIDNHFIDEQYTLLGHRQVRDTECPGDRLFNEISKWPHFLPLIYTPPPPPPPITDDITGPNELTSNGSGQPNESTTARFSLTTDSSSSSSSSSGSGNNESSRNNTNNSNNNNTNNLFLKIDDTNNKNKNNNSNLNNNSNNTNNTNNSNINSDENIIINNNNINGIFNDNLTIPKS